MKRIVIALSTAFGLLLLGNALAQVATVEIPGVETTAAKSSGLTALLMDGSVGEVKIVLRAVDANGDPVEGAAVSWTVKNSKDSVVYVVGSSATSQRMLMRAFKGMDLAVDGGTTDANGEAYLVVDSMTSGDTKVLVTVDEVAGKTYRGKDMRVVWF